MCLPIARCLGYQACLFTYGIEFCGLDPAPGQRKVLNVNLTCVDDHHPGFQLSNFANEVVQRREQIINLRYKVKNPNKLENTEFQSYVIGETDVFDVKCPSLILAFSEGYAFSNSSFIALFLVRYGIGILTFRYRGNCTEQITDVDKVSEQLWYNLARYGFFQQSVLIFLQL